MNLSAQCKLVLQHILQHGYISQLVASNYGVTRLASRMHDLRRAGFAVRAETQRGLRGKRYTRYYIDGAQAA